MKNNYKKQDTVLITGELPAEEGSAEALVQGTGHLKKKLLFSGMGAVFIGCLYLIFSPGKSKQEEQQNVRINQEVPQPSGAVLPGDKGAAYEQELLEKKNAAKREAFNTLSDYWSADSSAAQHDVSAPGGDAVVTEKKQDPSLVSYKNVRSTLGSFYRDDSPNSELEKEVKDLRRQLDERQGTKDPMENQLALMEKSYQMAAKYFSSQGMDNTITKDSKDSSEEGFVPLLPRSNPVATRLNTIGHKKVSQSGFLEASATSPARAANAGDIIQRNSIRACIEKSAVVSPSGIVQLRLLEPASLNGQLVAEGTILTALASFKNNRLQLEVTSMELGGSIFQVAASAYDLDGQKGLNMPMVPEASALSEMAGNMSNSAGTSFMMTQSAGQQVAADVSKGVIQGVSGYFSKKIRTPKVTVKAGHQLLLVSKK